MLDHPGCPICIKLGRNSPMPKPCRVCGYQNAQMPEQLCGSCYDLKKIIIKYPEAAEKILKEILQHKEVSRVAST